MCLYKDSKTKVYAVDGTSELDFIKVGEHQRPTLSPLLTVFFSEEVSKQVRRGRMWKIFYVDDIVLTGESKQEVKAMFVKLKEAMKIRCLRVNIEKTKLMVSGASGTDLVQLGSRGVGINLIPCTQCDRWCHKRYSGLRSFNTSRTFVCPKYTVWPQTTGEPPEDPDGELVE